ncbi:MAG: LptF/LptG family permease [Campylobacterales bacterium]|nr:LptF/LptG family permease [Campylobacterales bacterium]
MKRVEKYLIANLSSLFTSIFMPLFFTASVIFLIKLATYTAIIELTIIDMGKLYLFVLPEILFYTLPISFFIAATLSLFKLSNDNEAIVLFSLGIRPIVIIKSLFKPAFALFIVLACNFLILFPHTDVISTNYLLYKKGEAKFNLSASEFGNSFGDWLLYLGTENQDGTFGDVFLFNKKKQEEILISAQRAEVINDGGILRLKLTAGEGYSYSTKSFSQINFDTMFINDMMQIQLRKYETPLEYWQSEIRASNKKQAMITNTLISLFPLISIFLVVTIGIVHVRHQKSYIYLYLFISIVTFYGFALGLQGTLGYYTIPLVALTWLIVTYIMYKKNIVNKF